MPARRFYYIDVLKGLAILGVIMVHFNAKWVSPSSALSSLSAIGARCPQLFFLISAFLTWGSINKKQMSMWDFYVSRFYRLAPVYYLALIIGLIVLRPEVGLFNIISHFLFLNALTPEWANSILHVDWYIGDLALFYFIAPFLKRVIKDFNSSLVTFGISLLLSMCFTFIISCNSGQELIENSNTEMFVHTYCILNQLPAMILGIVAYYLIKEDRDGIGKGKKVLWASIIFAILFTTAFVVIGLNKRLVTSSVVAGLWFFILFILSYYFEKRLNKIGVGFFKFLKPFETLGVHSYGIYCFHVIVIFVVGFILRKYQVDSISMWIILFLLVCSLSYIIGLLVEKMMEKIIVVNKK